MTRTHFLSLLLSPILLKRVKPIRNTATVPPIILKLAAEGLAAISMLFKKGYN